MDATHPNWGDTDGVLWLRAKRGDDKAFLTIYRRHSDVLYAYLCRHFPSPHNDDVVADVFLALWRQRGRVRVRAGATLRPWLFAVARNIAMERYRSEQREQSIRDAAGALMTPVDQGDDAELVQQGYQVLLSLSREDQEILELCVLAGIAPAQAAPILGQPASTVRSRLTRARRRLAEAARQLALEETHP